MSVSRLLDSSSRLTLPDSRIPTLGPSRLNQLLVDLGPLVDYTLDPSRLTFPEPETPTFCISVLVDLTLLLVDLEYLLVDYLFYSSRLTFPEPEIQLSGSQS